VLTFLRDTFDIGSPGAVIGELADQARRVLGGGPGGGPGPGVVPLLLLLVLALLVLRRVLSRPEPLAVAGPVTEIRESESPFGSLALRRPRLRRPRRAADPRTASEAYLASLALLGRAPSTARRESETPSEHARRLREEPLGGPLGRLAADYALAEFAGRTLTGPEHRRALDRWRRIRALLDGRR
jgi:hypothetical protein